MSRTGLVCLVVAALHLFAGTGSANALTLRVERDSVVATDVTRGGSAVFFGVTFTTGAVPVRDRHASVVSDADGDGTVELPMPDGVSIIGIWAVVDTASGMVELGTRRGYRLIPFDDPAELSFLHDGRGHFTRLERQLDDAELLVVRPGEGAWILRATDGGEVDADYVVNGTLVLPFEKLAPLDPAGQPPASLLPGDVVVLIDAGDMRAFAGKLGEGK